MIADDFLPPASFYLVQVPSPWDDAVHFGVSRPPQVSLSGNT